MTKKELRAEIHRFESKISWSQQQLGLYGTPSKYPNQIREYKTG